MTKNELRNKYRQIRSSFSDEVREKLDLSITANLLKSNVYQSAEKILVYVSVGTEVSTKALISNAFAEGKTVAVPFCRENELEFRIINSLTDLIDGKFGIPTADDKCAVLTDFSDSLCVVPALSVDYDFNRLGYGGGFYDRFLSENKNIVSVALCFGDCLSEALTTEKTDMTVKGYITENGCYGGVFDA